MKLTVDGIFCKFMKISNNTLMMGSGGAFEPEFTIPVKGLMLSAEQLNQTMGDELTWRSWYNHSPPALPKPCDWWAHSKGAFPIPDVFEGDWLRIEVTGDRVLEFEADQPKNKGDEKIPAFRISKIVLTPLHGGNTEVQFNLHVRPGISKENLILQEHQHAEVKLSFSQTKPSTVKQAQGSLDLEINPEPAKLTASDTPRETGAAEGSATREHEPETEAKSQVAAKDGGPESDAPRDSGHDETDFTTREPTEDYSKPRELPTPSGEVLHLPSVEQNDARLAEISRIKEARRHAAMLLTSRRNDDLKEFEKGLEEKVAEHQDRPSNVIDGRK